MSIVPPTPSALYHYTCDHGHALIEDYVIPATWNSGRAVGTPGEFVWLTDLASPARDALGLTSNILTCDRTRHRYRVTDTTGALSWLEVRRMYAWGQELESAPDARPRHWWVSTEALPVVYDPIEVCA